MERLRECIEEEKNRIEIEQYPEDQKLKYFRQFFSENNTSLQGLLKANGSDIAAALILRDESIGNDDVIPILTIIYNNRKLFDNLSIGEMGRVLTIMTKLSDCGIYKEFYKILKRDSLFYVDKSYGYKTNIVNDFKKMIKRLDIPQSSFADFMFLLQKYNIQTEEACALTATLNSIKRKSNISENEIFDLMNKFPRKVLRQTEKLLSRNNKAKGQIADRLTEGIKEARTCFEKKTQSDKAKRRSLEKAKGIYDQIEEKVTKALQRKQITDPESLIYKIPSEKVRRQVLRIIDEHNKKYYAELLSEYEELSKKDASHYQVLLARYGVSPESYNVTAVMGKSLDDIEKMLEQLSKLKITESADIVEILQESTPKVLIDYVALVEKGIITSSLITANKSILNPKTEEYENFMSNFSLLREKKINPRYLKKCQNVFLTPHDRFADNIETIEKYNLMPQLKLSFDSSFLSQDCLAESIDLLLELGYEPLLEENLELLNYSDSFERLKVVKALNIPISSKNELVDILTVKKFIVPDDSITDYIYNAVEFEMQDKHFSSDNPAKGTDTTLETLQNYVNTSRTYDFEGTLISINKVERNLSKIDGNVDESTGLLYAIIDGSTLSDEEITKISTILNNNVKNNKTKIKNTKESTN